MTEAERNHFLNLILLCKPHHDLVDKTEPERYPSLVLERWKDDRESDFRKPLESIGAVSSSEQIFDMTIESGVIISGGTGGSALGAGGGGGPGVGPYARGGHGGRGGDYVRKRFELDESVVGLRIEQGEPGLGGTDGLAGQRSEDSTLHALFADGEEEEVVRLEAPRGGTSRSEFPDGKPRVVSAMFCNYAERRDNLLFIIGGGWDVFRANRFPAVVSGVAAYRLAGLPRAELFPLRFSLFGENGEEFGENNIELKELDLGRGRNIAIVAFTFPVEEPLTFTAELRSLGVPLHDMSCEILIPPAE